MSKKLRDQLSKMTTTDYLARIIELQNAVDGRDRKLAEQEQRLARQATIIEELRLTVTRLEQQLAQRDAADSTRGLGGPASGAPTR